MARVLRSLLIRLLRTGGRSRPSQAKVITVGADLPPPGVVKLWGRKWCDLSVGDRIELDGKVWDVTCVELEDADPPPSPSWRQVESGRHWLATGRVVVPENDEHYVDPDPPPAPR